MTFLLLSLCGGALFWSSQGSKRLADSQERFEGREPSAQSLVNADVPLRSIALDRNADSKDRGGGILRDFAGAKHPQEITPDSGSSSPGFDKRGRKGALDRSGRTAPELLDSSGALNPVTFTTQGRSYFVREDLQLVEPSDQQSELLRVGGVGNRWIIRRTEGVRESTSQVGSGWIVEDSRNHRLGFLSGAVFLQFENWDSRPDVPYAIRSVHPSIRSVILQPIVSSLEDFQQILADLRALQGVQRVEPEVLFKGAVPQ